MAQRDLLIVDTPTSVTVVVAICKALGEIYPTCVLRSDTGHVLHAVVDDDAAPVELDDLAETYPLYIVENGEPREAQRGDTATHALVPLRYDD